MTTQQELKAALESAGWRTDKAPMRNECDWYAWKPIRPAGWPDCDCNDKPPSLTLMPSFYALPHGKRIDGVSITVTGEKARRWFKLMMHGISPDEAMAAADEALLMLGAAWSAIGAIASKEPAP